MSTLFKVFNFICEVVIGTFVIYGMIIAIALPTIKEFIATIKGKPHSNIEIKLYLDDERACPKGWVPIHNYQMCIEMLQTFKPTHLSLDHDLGTEKTGYDVIKFIEEMGFNDPNYYPPIITVHSANPAGRKNMELGIQSIKRIIENRK